jgi:ABC-type branched-subunit amino acid transport system substrate-binding protein
MKFRTGSKVGVACLGVALLASACSPSTTNGSSASTTTAPGGSVATSSRGFDGKTIKVAGFGTSSLFSAAAVGAEARFKRANDTNELRGIKIQFVEFGDDAGDPATALSTARRLVTQDQIFAIVPDMSQFNPGSYLASQQVPYVGYALDTTYCSAAPSTSIWGFGFDGCLVSTVAPRAPDALSPLLKYVTQKTGKAHPTFLSFSADTQSGASAAKYNASSAEGAGFDVVYSKGVLPTTVSDYSPYVQQWMSSANGKAPDVMECLLTTQCINVLQALKAVGFSGIFYDNIGGTQALAKSLAGSITANFYNSAPNPGLTQMEQDMNAFQPGTQLVGYSNVPGYFAADMFIQALKKVRNDITPATVQKALATQTWKIPNLVGPIDYPASSTLPTPTCLELLQDLPDGSGFTQLAPYTCSTRTFKLDPRFTG